MRHEQMRLGELADKLEPRYGDRTVAKFAAEIGIAACTLKRCLSVYRAWKGIEAPAPLSYAVLQELSGSSRSRRNRQGEAETD
jgi:hypothetical protein